MWLIKKLLIYIYRKQNFKTNNALGCQWQERHQIFKKYRNMCIGKLEQEIIEKDSFYSKIIVLFNISF